MYSMKGLKLAWSKRLMIIKNKTLNTRTRQKKNKWVREIENEGIKRQRKLTLADSCNVQDIKLRQEREREKERVRDDGKLLAKKKVVKL